MPIKFSQNWFETTAKENFEKYVKPLHGEFLEIGCFEGNATRWMLDNTNAKITVIDTFEGSDEHKDMDIDTKNLRSRFEENIKDKADRVTIHEGKSQDVLKKLDGQFDFIYIDGSHYTSDVLQDAVLSFSLLKNGGIMIFDDYEWFISSNLQPKTAINSFILCYLGQIEVVGKNSQCIIKKY